MLDRTGEAEGLEPLVELTMSYQKLTVTHKTGGITAIDNWIK